jgi:hypothetical protein
VRKINFTMLCGVLLFLSASAVFAQPAAKATVDMACAKCHNTARVYQASKDVAAWNKTLEKMMAKGAAVKPNEKESVLRFLNTLNR